MSSHVIHLDPRLFTPFRLGGAVLPSRFVMPAMQRGWCVDGAPGADLGRYYRRRVEGGVGMVISESCAVDHVSGTAQPSAARMNAATAPAWKACIEEVKSAGGVMLIQLWHEGALRPDADGHTLSPSGLIAAGQPRGRAATLTDIAAIADAFEQSAVMAQDAGADGVEIHAAHGYLLDQFLWAVTNLRDDGYGGDDIHDRSRLVRDIVRRVRERCGEEFIISVRLSQWKEKDFTARIAPDPEALERLVLGLREAGATLLHCSTRRFWEPEWAGETTGLAGWCRRLGGLPTVAVGSVGLDRDVMESFSQDGEAALRLEASIDVLNARFQAEEFDLVAVGRSLIADPDWVAKVRSGDLGGIVAFRKEHIAMLDLFE